MKLTNKIKEDWLKYSENRPERKATNSEAVHTAYSIIIMLFALWFTLEFISYVNNKFFKEKPFKSYNIEVTYSNGNKDTFKNIKSQPYFDYSGRLTIDNSHT